MNQKPQNSTEIDSENLRRMLEDIYTQLTVPYIKKRATQNSHKQSPVEELQDAISYLTEKERELQLSLDIAKYLLDSNEELQSQISNLKNTQNALCQENSSLAKENNFLERKLQENHIKYDKISENLSKTKGKLERVATNMRKIQENTEKTHTQLVDIEELNEAKFFFDSQTGIYQRKIEEMSKTLEKANEDIELLNKKLTEAKSKNENLTSKHKSAVIKIKESEKMQKILVGTNEKIDRKVRQLKMINEKLAEKVRKQEEELKCADFQQVTRTSEGQYRSSSLLAELQIVEGEEGRFSLDSEEERLSPNVIFSPERYHSCSPRYTSFIFNPALDICQQSSTLVLPLKSSRDPIEEYFTLTTQAVKMNSPHMDRIGILPASFLYQKAKEQQVPFHRWHVWIESQLNFEYIQHLYNKPKGLSRISRFFSRNSKN